MANVNVFGVLIFFATFFRSNFGEELFPFDPRKTDFVEIFRKSVANFNESNWVTLESTGDVYDNFQCTVQLKKMVNDSYEASVMKMLDSWGKLPSGILVGHLSSMGNFDECLSISADYGDEAGVMRGQYCTASVNISKLLPSPTPALFSMLPKLKLGLCLPHSCDPHFVNTIVDHFSINPNSCSYKNLENFEVIDLVAIGFFSLIVLVMLLSSIYEYAAKKNGVTPASLFVAFSVLSNCKKLFRISTKRSPSTIECLNGIRVISTIWVIYGHTHMFFHRQALLNPQGMLQWKKTLWATLMVNGLIVVDTFFLLSGLLVAHLVFRELDKTKGKLKILQMYAHRYFRLTPVLMITILFVVSLLRYLGNGPVWKSEMHVINPNCERDWWKFALYVQNYLFDGQMCLYHTWYLAADFQLYILSPLILIPLYKLGRKFIPVLGLLLVLSSGYVVWIFSTFGFTHRTHTPDKFKYTYLPTHVRYSPWLIGVALGYLLFKTKDRKINLSKITICLGWILSICGILTICFGTHGIRQVPTNQYIALASGLYDALSRPAWAMAVAWVIFACQNGYGGPVNSFLSYPGWQPLARLSYCMYIAHFVVQTVIAGTVHTEVRFSNFSVILAFWCSFGLTFCVAIILTLAFEFPIITLEKEIFGTKKTEPLNDRPVSTGTQIIKISNISEIVEVKPVTSPII